MRLSRSLAAYISVLLALLMSTPAFAQAGEPSPFQDMASVPWAAPDVALLYHEGIAHGTGTTTFSPSLSLTGEQTLVFLYHFFPHSSVSAAAYPGVDTWAQSAVGWAFRRGIVADPGAFQATVPAPRAQVVTWTVRALAIPTAGAPAPTFNDAAHIPVAYSVYVGAAQADSLVVGGPGGNFHPMEPITRAQMAALLVKAQYVLARQTSPPLASFSWQAPSVSSAAYSGGGWVGTANLALGTVTAGHLTLGPAGAASLSMQETFVAWNDYGEATYSLSNASGPVSTLWLFYDEPGQGSGNTQGTVWLNSGGGVSTVDLAETGSATAWQGTLTSNVSSSLVPTQESYAVSMVKGEETWQGSATLPGTSSPVELIYQGPPLPTPLLFLQQVVAESNLLTQALGC